MGCVNFILGAISRFNSGAAYFLIRSNAFVRFLFRLLFLEPLVFICSGIVYCGGIFFLRAGHDGEALCALFYGPSIVFAGIAPRPVDARIYDTRPKFSWDDKRERNFFIGE